MSAKRVFAISMGEFVELRTGSYPPKAKISKLTIPVTVDHVPVYDDWGLFIKYSKTKKRTTLEQTFYLGGRVVGITNYRKYSDLAKLFKFKKLKKNGIVELPSFAMDPKWRRENL